MSESDTNLKDSRSALDNHISQPLPKKRIRYDYNYLINFCEENNITLKKAYEDEKITRDTIIIAKCLLCENLMVSKSFRVLINGKNFGCNICKPKISLQKTKDTSMKRYGVHCSLQNDMVRQKIKDTNLKKFGCENPSQSEEIKQKKNCTNMKKLGCENPMQNEGVRQKAKNTNIERLGCEYPTQSEIVRQKEKIQTSRN